MRLTNKTDIPNEIIRDIIRFVRPPGIARVRIHVADCRGKYQGHGGGRACLVRVAPAGYPMTYRPYQYGQNKGKKWWIANRLELIVVVMAHELRHCWQTKARNKAGYAWGARGRYSEIDTEAFAIRKLRAWRKRFHDFNDSTTSFSIS